MTPAALSNPSSRLHDALEPWCAVGATGALRLLDAPGGAVYLAEGRISYAECPPACGLDRLLTASGRLSTEVWRGALNAGRADRKVGETLVRQGLLAPAELESLVLAALYGAAHFLVDLDSGTRFEMGAGHVVGPVVALDLRSVCRELDRRRRILDDTWPDAKLDSHAILPARKLTGHHVTLTSLQWEIVANADRRRTPIELARSLGRDTFATLLEVRRLARAGLVEPGRQGTALFAGAARARDTPPERRQPDAATRPPNGPDREAPDRETPDREAPGREAPDQPGDEHRIGRVAAGRPGSDHHAIGRGNGTGGGDGRAATDGSGNGVVPTDAHALAPLPRRQATASDRFPERRGAGPDAALEDELCPESTLLRIRDALEALR